MKQIVSLKELKQNINKYSFATKKGNSFIITKKSKPIFRIVPLDNEEVWERVVDFTKIRKGGVSINELLSVL